MLDAAVLELVEVVVADVLKPVARVEVLELVEVVVVDVLKPVVGVEVLEVDVVYPKQLDAIACQSQGMGDTTEHLRDTETNSTAVQPTGRKPEKTASIFPELSLQNSAKVFGKAAFSQLRVLLEIENKVVIAPDSEVANTSDAVPAFMEYICPLLDNCPLLMLKVEASIQLETTAPSEPTYDSDCCLA